MAKIQFESERCFGCGACWSVAPENFTFGDDGRTVMISNEANEAAIEASEICPVSAILIEGNCECDNCDCDNCNSTNNKECTCNECNCTEENNCGCLENCTCEDECNCAYNCNCGCKNK